MHGLLSRRFLLGIAPLLAVAMVSGCNPGALPPAPYQPPAIGTTYHYSTGLINKVTSAEGWRVGFVDNRGAPGSRVGVFISEDPSSPVTIEPADLLKLWPLELGKQMVINVKHGDEVYSWDFRITSQEMLTVGGQQVATYVVQAVQNPVLVRSPRKTTATINTWWFSPELNAVVRYKTTYTGGPTGGRIYEATLTAIEPPSSGGAKR